MSSQRSTLVRSVILQTKRVVSQREFMLSRCCCRAIAAIMPGQRCPMRPQRIQLLKDERVHLLERATNNAAPARANVVINMRKPGTDSSSSSTGVTGSGVVSTPPSPTITLPNIFEAR